MPTRVATSPEEIPSETRADVRSSRPARASHHLARRKAVVTCTLLGLLLAGLMVVGATSGAVDVGLREAGAIIATSLGYESDVEVSRAQEAVLVSIRLPRVILGALIGATLGICGAAVQALFRNPLAEPTLIGTASGAAVFAVAAILGLGALGASATTVAGVNLDAIRPWILPIASFAGGMIATLLVYKLASEGGRVDVTTMLLAGIAINALGWALVGLGYFLADDAQLRSITFWSLGSLASATWSGLAVAAPAMLLSVVAICALGRPLDAMTLGDAEAYHLGVPIARVRALVIVLVALAVGAAVSQAGIIGFVGLVVPHVLRMMLGPSNRLLLPASALFGGALLVGADVVARTIAAPAELPLGVVTALIGAPYFLWLLVCQRRHGGLR